MFCSQVRVPDYAPLAQFDFDAARRDLEAHILLPLQIARNAAGKVRPGGRCCSSVAQAVATRL